ncbi:hypothetical protein P389DRAFT_178616 [Cystobasidium minutum MCA 4210]|uniref:uncharacterized protein n=1 Tax=Cystobasidium minutum MCA 4210 TaxID=1397322 RepID=UPI0034CE6432|eukprot:jgi/Rhomi1/178616/fgenesh1_pg.2_\
MEDYVQLPLTATALRKWLRFSDKGGIGKAVSLIDKLAENGTDELMFMEGDPITVLMQLDNGRYLGSCEGVVGIFHEQDVRFTTKLKKPVFTKKPQPKPQNDPQSNSRNSPLQEQTVKSPHLRRTDSPITPSALSPAQTPISGGPAKRSFSAPTSATQLLYLQNDAHSLPVQHAPGLNTAFKASDQGVPKEHPHRGQDQHPPPHALQKDIRTQSFITGVRSPSAMEDNEDILSSYVYDDTEVQQQSSQVVPQRLARSEETLGDVGLSYPRNTYISSLPAPKKESSRDPSRLLAPLKIDRSASGPSDIEHLQDQSASPFYQSATSPRVHILPVLPAGVSLKQLRERSSPRFPLSPRSASMNDSMSRSGSGSQSSQFSPSTTTHRALDSTVQQMNHIPQSQSPWSQRPETPVASPVPSSFVSVDSPRSPLSPMSPHYVEYGSIAASTSASTFDHLQQASELGAGNKPQHRLASDARSVSSVDSSLKGLVHSRSMSSLTRAGSIFQRRPSLPNRSDSNLGNTATEGVVELSNAQFEFVQPSGWDSEGESPHSAAESLNSSTSARLVTRPSASAKERVRSVYISDFHMESHDPDRVLDKFGFIHNPHLAITNGDSDVPSGQDAAALQAYRARELKWVSIMSSMPARSARSSSKVKKLVNHGIPNSVRGKAWTYLAETATRRKETVFHELCTKEDPHEAAEITRDVALCFQDHSHFADEDSIGRQDLCNVLRALVHYLPNIQYRRGLCYIAGMLLLHTEAESAFWLLVAIASDYLPTYFAKGARGSVFDANIIMYAIQRGEPDLHRHLDQQGIKLVAIMESWLSCAFVRILPWASQLRMMDLFFIGEKVGEVALRFALRSSVSIIG